MKKILYLFLLCCLLTTCQSGNKKDAEKKVVTVTIEPLRYLTEAIAGERIKVISMVPQGSSPETYDPTPQQLIDLAQSNAYLGTGYIGFDQTWGERLAENAPNVIFFDLSEGIDLIRNETHVHTHHHHKATEQTGNYKEEEHHHHHTAVEPHIWTSAINAQIIAENIFRALCEIDNSGTAFYTNRKDSLMKRLQYTDSLLCTQLSAPEADRSFMIYHPALSYFARDYGLHQIAIEDEGKEPSPAQLKQLIEQCKEEGVRTIFVQPEFDRRNAEIIAQQTNTRVIPINPLAYEWEKELLNICNALCHTPSSK